MNPGIKPIPAAVGPGLAKELVLTVMEARGLIGSRGGLTRKGAGEAQRVQAERWGS